MGKLRSLHYVYLLVLPGIIVNRLDCINFYLCTHELSGVLINQNIHRKQISHSPGMHFEWVTLGIFRIGRFRTLMFRHTEKVTVLLHWCLLNMCLFNNAVLVSFNQPSQYEIILFSLINTDLLCCQNSVLGKSWVNKSLGQGICFRADNAQEQVDFALCHNLIHFHKSYLFLIQYLVGQGVVMKFDLLYDSHILRGWDMSLRGYSSCADDATDQHSLCFVPIKTSYYFLKPKHGLLEYWYRTSDNATVTVYIWKIPCPPCGTVHRHLVQKHSWPLRTLRPDVSAQYLVVLSTHWAFN